MHKHTTEAMGRCPRQHQFFFLLSQHTSTRQRTYELNRVSQGLHGSGDFTIGLRSGLLASMDTGVAVSRPPSRLQPRFKIVSIIIHCPCAQGRRPGIRKTSVYPVTPRGVIPVQVQKISERRTTQCSQSSTSPELQCMVSLQAGGRIGSLRATLQGQRSSNHHGQQFRSTSSFRGDKEMAFYLTPSPSLSTFSFLVFRVHPASVTTDA